MDGRTGMTKVKVAFRNFAKASTNTFHVKYIFSPENCTVNEIITKNTPEPDT